VGSYDPCCQVVADFTADPGDSEFSWNFNNSSTGGESYAWSFGDGSTSTDESPGHTYAANGQYTVCLTVTGTCNGAPTTADQCQTVSISVGIDELRAGHGAPVLYPSPANAAFTARSARPIEAIRLSDGQGRMVGTVHGRGALRAEIAVEHLPAGACLAHAAYADG